MRKTGKIVLNFFSLLLLFSISVDGISQGVFSPEPVYNPIPPKSTAFIEYVFKEFNNKDLYNNAVNNINWFSGFKSPPFKIENATYYNPALQFNVIDSFIREKRLVIDALHYYINVEKTEQLEGRVRVETRLPYEYIYQPFYLLNGEVTNKEYREFIYYVRDSIVRSLLAYSSLKNARDYGEEVSGRLIIKWNKKIPYDSYDEEISEAMQPMYLPEGARFYPRKEIDTRKINYKYELIKDSVTNVINVYPDTLLWVNGLIFNNSNYGFESYCNMYSWHPAYDQYPVVGLTYEQVKAFLFWKTQKLQKEFDEKGLPYLVEYDVPNEIELDMISVCQKLNGDKLYALPKRIRTDEIHRKYNLDLCLNSRTETWDGSKKQAGDHTRNEYLTDELIYKEKSHQAFIFPGEGAYKPKNNNKASLIKYNSMVDYGGIPFLNGNASEWMHENLTKLDTSVYTRKDGTLVKWRNRIDDVSKTFPFSGNYEEAYSLERRVNGLENDFENIKYRFIDSTKTKNEICKLVRGANWYDTGDWQTGHLKKTVAPKDSAFSTVGFRYVVRFKKK